MTNTPTDLRAELARLYEMLGVLQMGQIVNREGSRQRIEALAARLDQRLEDLRDDVRHQTSHTLAMMERRTHAVEQTMWQISADAHRRMDAMETRRAAAAARTTPQSWWRNVSSKELAGWLFLVVLCIQILANPAGVKLDLATLGSLVMR